MSKLPDNKPRDLRRANRIWKALVAGLCGSIAHSGLMVLKYRLGLLQSFQPYEDLQQALSHLVGSSVHPLIPWAFSFLNGSVFLGFLFGRTYRWLPGRSGAAKGCVFGVLGWTLMGLVFFPALGRGLFASQAGLGLQPALFSLMMILTYSVVMGITYARLIPGGTAEP
ncbi:DUF6789 family protein [Bradyrhizobium sp.]|uniref:DUF6789 family protein n=1 Tax=Bradyrhizobium sp. TaxID=376 RepID=UPI003C73867F